MRWWPLTCERCAMATLGLASFHRHRGEHLRSSSRLITSTDNVLASDSPARFKNQRFWVTLRTTDGPRGGGWSTAGPQSAGHWATLARSLSDGVPCSNHLSHWHLRNGSKSPGHENGQPPVGLR